MTTIAFLGAKDFTIVPGKGQGTLSLLRDGLFLVFFKLSGCDNCAQFEPVFARLAQEDKRMEYGVANISTHREIAIRSQNTTTPITAVPALIMYIKGRPHAKFNASKDLNAIKTNIAGALKATNTPQSRQFMPTGQTPISGQNMYGGPGAGGPGALGGPTYMPDIKAPSMKGAIKNYISQNPEEDDDDNRLLIPDNVVPYNAPWETEFHSTQ